MSKGMLYVGPTGSGKTQRLIDGYREFAQGGIPTDRILVLVMNASQVGIWRKALALPASGPLEIYTYFGFVQKELRTFWDRIQRQLPGAKKVLEPVFLTIETSQYLMQYCVEEMRAKGHFQEVKAPPERIAVQLAGNLSVAAAVSGFSLAHLARRLGDSWGGEGNSLPGAVEETLSLYRQRCIDSRLVDYGLSLELYNTILLHDPEYRSHIFHKVSHLVVDDLDETVPAAQDFIELIFDDCVSVSMAFGLDGGHSSFFGAHPQLAWERFAGRCERVELPHSFTCSPEAFRLGSELARRIEGQEGGRLANQVVEEVIEADLRGEMIERVGARILELIGSGVSPNEIVVIAPFVDKVLEFTLQQIGKRDGYQVENLTRSRRLLDEPYAQTLITLAALAHPQWGIQLNGNDLASALGLLLGLDPIRASLLAAEVGAYAQGGLPPLDVGVRRRIGFDKGEFYDALEEWIKSYREGEELPVDAFFQRVFGELLSPLSPKEGDLLYCRQLILSAHRFRRFVEEVELLQDQAGGKRFVEMVQRGTIAAEPLVKKVQDPQAVSLCTPYAYFLVRGSSQVQLWLDISSETWYRGDVKELSNPHVISRGWEEGQVWSDEMNLRARRENGARTVRALLRRCRGKVIPAASLLNSRGQEQDGPLPAVLELAREEKEGGS